MDDETLRDALAAHRAIDARDDDGYTVTTAALDNTVRVAYGELVVTVAMPTIAEVVVDDDPADVVVDGWFEALEQHLADAYSVITTEAAAEAVVVRGATDVEVTYRLTGGDANALAADAKALVDFVVGTYLQSAIPGYEYDDPMRGLLGKARQRGRSDVES